MVAKLGEDSVFKQSANQMLCAVGHLETKYSLHDLSRDPFFDVVP